VDIPVEYIGMRPGEKLFEELFITPGENAVKTSHEKIMVLRSDNNFNWDRIRDKAEIIINGAKNYNDKQIIASLRDFVPEYTPFEPPTQQA